MIYRNGEVSVKKKLLIGIIALIGFVTTIKLAVIYYESNYNPYALSSFCSINDFIDCDGIAKTTSSQFLGIPLAYWGMGFYLFVLMLLFTDKIKQLKVLHFFDVFKNPMAYISSLGLVSFLISVLLAIKSVFVLHKVCILCFFTYILNALIALIATDFDNDGFIGSIKASFMDFIEGVKKYSLHFVIAVILAVSFLTYTTLVNPFTPQVKKLNSIKEYLKMTTNPYAVSGNDLGLKNASVKIELYSDYACPMCFAYNIMIHKLVKELGNVYVESHNLPLDRECNKYLRKQVHKGACRYAKYAVAAKNQGKYWDMSTLLFEHHPKNDDEAVLLAKKLNLDVDKFKSDICSKETMKVIAADIDYAVSQGVLGTPTIVINGKKYAGMKPYYELKEIIKNNE